MTTILPFAVSTTTTDVDWVGLKTALAADSFDNGRTPEQYRVSHESSWAVAFVRDGDRVVGNGRVLSDGVCNAYLVDIWTASSHRRRGVGSAVVRALLATVPGQHVALLTDSAQPLYASLGFTEERDAMSLVVGRWLDPTS